MPSLIVVCVLMCSGERDAVNLLAYDELQQHGVANVFDTVEQDGFCSGTESESEGEEEDA